MSDCDMFIVYKHFPGVLWGLAFQRRPVAKPRNNDLDRPRIDRRRAWPEGQPQCGGRGAENASVWWDQRLQESE